jgi:nitroreductase
MTSLTEPRPPSAVRRAAVRATLAPSIHNSQPWRFLLSGTSLEVHADWSRRLRVLDPRGRQLLISCGCAVFNARVALAAAGYEATVERWPEPTRPNLAARLTLLEQPTGAKPLGSLDSLIESRHTNRRRFTDDPVPTDVVDALTAIARADGAQLFPIVRDEHRQAIARLSQQADNLENIDPAYRAELRAWTSDDPARLDGVPAVAVPHVDGSAHDDVSLRDFDTHGHGALPTETYSSAQQCLLLLGTVQDTPAAWLRAGEALEHMLLEITRRGYVASPFTSLIEVAATNAALRDELELTMHPHILLRVGHAPITPASRRRRLGDMLDGIPLDGAVGSLENPIVLL